ncbi:MAG: efflux transporter outer membrane subunit [Deltaproteobacteria bacterium]|nr:MAG: efflux transporter outer membrane subunit [Deltaproteobacteria bacterium]
MMGHIRKRALFVLIPFLLLSFGCRPSVRMPSPEELGFRIPPGFDSAAGGEAFAPAPWWRDFGDPSLEKVVDKVIASNFDVRESEARIEELAALFSAAGAGMYPSLDFSGRWSRSKIVYRGFGGGEIKSIVSNYEVDLVPSYEVDLWGKVREGKKGSFYDYLSSQQTFHAVVESAVAEAVSKTLEASFLARERALMRERVETAEKLLEAVESRFRRGIAPLSDVLQARRNLRTLSSLLPPVERRLDAVRRELHLLLGEYPSGKGIPEVRLIDPRDLHPVPPGLPSDLLKRRPDIQAAESALRAQYHRVFEAWKKRFPSITLSASAGYSSDELKSLFDPASEIWNVAVGIVAPIFRGGALKALQEAEEARFRQFAVRYARTILQAFYEVEVGLSTEESLFREREERVKEVEAARDSLEAVKARYEKGLEPFLSLLEAQEKFDSSRVSLLETDLAIVKNRIFLYRALGGWSFAALEGKRERTGRQVK